MKNTIRVLMATLLSFVLSATPAMAAPVEASTVVGNVKSAVGEIYDASVISRMVGRSGAATATGSKGIAFEIMYADKKNFTNIFKKELKTIQTKNPTATQVDLVTINNDGSKVVERLQLKDIQSDSGIRKLLSRIKNGDYRQAQLVGTDETVEIYNDMVAKKGVTKAMKKSGISTKDTQRIANKAVSQVPSAATAAESVATTSATFAAFGAVIGLGESLIEGDDAADTISNTVVSGAKGAVAGAAGGAAGTLATAGLAAVGVANPVALVIIPVTATISASMLTDKGLEGISEMAQANLSAALHDAQDAAEEKIEYIAVAIEDSGIKEKAANTIYELKDASLASINVATSTVVNKVDSLQGNK